MDKKFNRKRKRPSRFGDNIAISDSSAEEADFADNSFDDPNFEISDSKKTRMNDTSSGESITFEPEENFDEEFDQTPSSKRDEFVADVTESNHSEKELTSVPSEENDFESRSYQRLQKHLMILQENSVEILTRLAVIEESLLKSGNLITVKTAEVERQAFSKYHTFLKSNSLPMKCINEFKNFESKLIDDKFQKEAITALSDFPGMKAAKGNKPKLLKRVLFAFVEKPFLGTITWTGKAGKGQPRKHAMKDYPNFLHFLHSILKKIEGTYEDDMFYDHLKNNVLSHAYEYAKKANSESKHTSDGASVNNIEVPSTSSGSCPENSKYSHSQEKSNETDSTMSSKIPNSTLRQTVEKSNVQFSNIRSEEKINHSPAEFYAYEPEKHASVAKGKSNHQSQQPNTSESVLYGDSFESQKGPQLPILYRIANPNGYQSNTKRYPATYNEMSSDLELELKMVEQQEFQRTQQFLGTGSMKQSNRNIWPNSWKAMMTTNAQKSSSLNSNQVSNVDHSRAKYLLSLAQNNTELFKR